MPEASLSVVSTEIGDAPLPEAPPEPVAPDDKPTPTRSRTTTRSKPRRRTLRSRVSRLAQPGRPEPDGGAGERAQDEEPLSEPEVVRAFWWVYKAWCKFLGAPLEAERADFQELGEAWVGLGRKVPGLRIMLAAIAPAVATFGFLDLLQSAWDKRTRRRERKAAETEPPAPPAPDLSFPPTGGHGGQG